MVQVGFLCFFPKVTEDVTFAKHNHIFMWSKNQTVFEQLQAIQIVCTLCKATLTYKYEGTNYTSNNERDSSTVNIVQKPLQYLYCFIKTMEVFFICFSKLLLLFLLTPASLCLSILWRFIWKRNVSKIFIIQIWCFPWSRDEKKFLVQCNEKLFLLKRVFRFLFWKLSVK